MRYRYVKFYRDGSYITTVKTDAYGKARIKVSKHFYPKTYKIVIAGDAVHWSGVVSKSLAFRQVVFDETADESADSTIESSAYLSKGHYVVFVYGDEGELYVQVGADDDSYIDIDPAYSGDSKEFWVNEAGTMSVFGISIDSGWVRVVIYKYL